MMAFRFTDRIVVSEEFQANATPCKSSTWRCCKIWGSDSCDGSVGCWDGVPRYWLSARRPSAVWDRSICISFLRKRTDGSVGILHGKCRRRIPYLDHDLLSPVIHFRCDSIIIFEAKFGNTVWVPCALCTIRWLWQRTMLSHLLWEARGYCQLPRLQPAFYSSTGLILSWTTGCAFLSHWRRTWNGIQGLFPALQPTWYMAQSSPLVSGWTSSHFDFLQGLWSY